MKTIVLAGGFGTRLMEETGVRPKPLVEIGGKPILWHIMRIYAAAGFNEFVVALGYKGEAIKRWFLDFSSYTHDMEISLAESATRVIRNGPVDDWHVALVDTGQSTQTGGRLKRLARHIGNEPCMATYGDGVADIDIRELVAFHKAQGRLATLTAVRPPARFGALELTGTGVSHFREKPQTGQGWINGGFFVFEPQVFDYIDGDETFFEREPLQRLAEEGQLSAYLHNGFWQAMDTLREKRLLEAMWQQGQAPWTKEALQDRKVLDRLWPQENVLWKG